MRFLLIIAFTVAICATNAYSQLDNFLDKVKDKVEKKIEEKADEKVDETINNAVDGDKKTETEEPQNTEPVKKEKSKKGKDKTGDTKLDNPVNDNKKTENKEDKKATPTDDPMKLYSKFDFVSGEKVIFFEDFSQDKVGDFPAKWNANGRGEVVTTSKYPGNWLKMSNTSTYVPEMITKVFPENFTLEYDLISTFDVTGAGDIYLDIVHSPEKSFLPEPSADPALEGGTFDFSPGYEDNSIFRINNRLTDEEGTFGSPIRSDMRDNVLKGKDGKIIHISLSVNKQRLRVFINQLKVFDLPRFFSGNQNLNKFSFRTWFWGDEGTYTLLMSNFRYAEGKPDVRSKLMSEGKIVTRGILFDSGSDKIKAESFGTLKEIADVLKENAAVKVKIVGHTDSDGDAASNLDLSKRRAAAVSKSLSDNFQINSGRMTTDGKGQTEPVSENTTTEGKANNRRVEFIKQ